MHSALRGSGWRYIGPPVSARDGHRTRQGRTGKVDEYEERGVCVRPRITHDGRREAVLNPGHPPLLQRRIGIAKCEQRFVERGERVRIGATPVDQSARVDAAHVVADLLAVEKKRDAVDGEIE